MSRMATTVENISGVQQQILAFIKQQRETTNAAIAEQLSVSYEAVRQQLRKLEDEGLIVSRDEETEGRPAGRPAQLYALSPAGDHLFPKNYDELAVELIDTVSDSLGPDALRQVLTAFTDEKVRRWSPHLKGETVAERLEDLRGFYLADDPYMRADEHSADGDMRLVEGNCPYLNVASRRPAICSVTVSALSRLLGYRVSRDQRFQNGDAQCVFHVHLDEPIDTETFHFAFEEELDPGDKGR